MNTQHTPRPWAADGYHVSQYGLNGMRMIADVCYTGPHHTLDEANARIIAAALDILEALKTAVAYPLTDDWYKQANGAIAKATGKDQA